MLQKAASLQLKAFHGPVWGAAPVDLCGRRADTGRTPHYTKLHEQTSANTIHHQGTGWGTLVLYKHHIRSGHLKRLCSWGGFWQVLKKQSSTDATQSGPANKLTLRRATGVASSPTHCRLPSLSSTLVTFSRSLSSNADGLPHATFPSHLTSLFVWSVRVIKFPSGFPTETLGQERRDIFVENHKERDIIH